MWMGEHADFGIREKHAPDEIIGYMLFNSLSKRGFNQRIPRF